MTLTANRIIVRKEDLDLRGFDVAAGEHIYQDGLVGVHPATGYLKTFEPGDIFVGVASEEADNSSSSTDGDTTGTSGYDGECQVWIQGEFQHAISGVAVTDVGRAVFATADDTLAFTGHPDAFVGRVVRYVSSGVALVKLKHPGEKPAKSDLGSVEFVYDGEALIEPTGATAGPTFSEGFELDSVLGLGVLNIAGGGLQLQFDATAEVAQASIATPAIFDVTKGITFELTGYLSGIGDDAALDVDWGLSTVLDDTVKADMDDGTCTNHVRFHLNGASANILAESDDDTTDVAATDTTVDNATDTAKTFLIVVRSTGVCELYIDGTRVLSTTTFQCGAAGSFAAFANIEKTSNDTVAVFKISRLRAAGAAA